MEAPAQAMAELELPDDEKELSHVAERDEVDAIIARVVETGGACDRADFHRVRVVVERYQEQSSLLDPHLESWIAPLAGVIRDQAHLGEDADMALVQRVSKVLHAFATVRGHKTVVRFFPHEAKDLEPAVALLTRSHGADALRPRDGRPPLGAEEIEELGSAWETRATIILWLCILGTFYLTLVPVRPRRRGERRSLRTFNPGASLRPGSLAFNPDTPRRLSTPTDAYELHPDIASYGTTLRGLNMRDGKTVEEAVAEVVCQRLEGKGRRE